MISWSVLRDRYPISILTAAIVLIFGSLLIGYRGLRDPTARARNGSVWFVDLNHGVPIKMPLGTDSPTDLSTGTQPAVHLLAFTCASNPPNDEWFGYLEAHGHLAFPSSPPHRSQTGTPGGALVRAELRAKEPQQLVAQYQARASGPPLWFAANSIEGLRIVEKVSRTCGGSEPVVVLPEP